MCPGKIAMVATVFFGIVACGNPTTVVIVVVCIVLTRRGLSRGFLGLALLPHYDTYSYTSL